ncbi:FxDxF family PEP-CTERM protein [Duganella levis]|uniref:PEP-CTERM sorting domain-containing protein n=1 Tax=Duganella levis TaxID=2692169 RepID=A0ABW9W4V6_9BURK|nr:FxDxF family PEP-CTERM protein [Duganella levis]MYN29062.1 PEP-CTERM sorting domain-containing protein [Duganella levis]
MKKMLQAVAVSATMMLTVAGASAATTVTLTGAGSSYTGGFNVTHSSAGSFTDEFIISPEFPSTTVSAVLSTIGFEPSQYITFSSVKLNGIALTLSNLNPGVLAYTPSEFALSGPITLTVVGSSGGNASYSGTINLTVVPEPEGYALMLAGLGVVGYISRRKRHAKLAA